MRPMDHSQERTQASVTSDGVSSGTVEVAGHSGDCDHPHFGEGRWCGEQLASDGGPHVEMDCGVDECSDGGCSGGCDHPHSGDGRCPGGYPDGCRSCDGDSRTGIPRPGYENDDCGTVCT